MSGLIQNILVELCIHTLINALFYTTASQSYKALFNNVSAVPIFFTSPLPSLSSFFFFPFSPFYSLFSLFSFHLHPFSLYSYLLCPLSLFTLPLPSSLTFTSLLWLPCSHHGWWGLRLSWLLTCWLARWLARRLASWLASWLARWLTRRLLTNSWGWLTL